MSTVDLSSTMIFPSFLSRMSPSSSFIHPRAVSFKRSWAHRFLSCFPADLQSTNRSSVFSGHHGQLTLSAVYLDEYRDRLFLGGKDVLYSLLLGPTSSESKEVSLSWPSSPSRSGILTHTTSTVEVVRMTTCFHFWFRISPSTAALHPQELKYSLTR